MWNSSFLPILPLHLQSFWHLLIFAQPVAADHLPRLASLFYGERSKMQKVLVLCGLLLVAACVENTSHLNTTYKRGEPVQLTDKQVEIVKEGVKKTLKDPSSAMFGSIYAVKNVENGKGNSDQIIYVCGTVNAKNSFGGYTGQTPFNGILGLLKDNVGIFSPASIGGDKTKTDITLSVCNTWGISFM